MIIIDTSAWIEFFRPTGNKAVSDAVKYVLENEQVGIGDLIYCEILQGAKDNREIASLKELLSGLAKFNMVDFNIADKSASNYRYLRSKGITVRKTIDVLIGTFCIENQFQLLQYDSDFDLMASGLPLKLFGKN